MPNSNNAYQVPGSGNYSTPGDAPLPDTAGTNWQDVGSTIVGWADQLLPHIRPPRRNDLPPTAGTDKSDAESDDDDGKKIILYVLGAIVAIVIVIFILKR